MIIKCPCGCGGEARTKRGYAGVGCNLRAITRDVRIARTKAYLAIPENLARHVASGRRGGHKNRPKRWDDLLAQWAELARTKGPSYALATCYWRGYHSGYNKKRPYRRRHRPVNGTEATT